MLISALSEDLYKDFSKSHNTIVKEKTKYKIVERPVEGTKALSLSKISSVVRKELKNLDSQVLEKQQGIDKFKHYDTLLKNLNTIDQGITNHNNILKTKFLYKIFNFFGAGKFLEVEVINTLISLFPWR